MKGRAKTDRHSIIKQIIESRDISTQEELMAELEAQGFEITQATISRDIGDLGLQKVRIADTGADKNLSHLVYSLPEIERLRSLLNEFMIQVDCAENLVVVKTRPGTAQALASAIDSAKWNDVLGTVGGDDTILVIGRTRKVADYVASRISKLHQERLV